MNELLIYGGASFAFAAGWAFKAFTMPPLGDLDWRTVAVENHRKFVDACRECNAIEEDYQEALASNRRLTDALQCKNERLERIAEKGRVSKSGAAVHLAKIAEGVA